MNRSYRNRLLVSLGLLVASTFAVFAWLEAAPGGPAAAYILNPRAGANEIAALVRELGAGTPFFLKYLAWLSHVLRGDLGWSPTNAEPVAQVLLEPLPATLEFAFFGFAAVLAAGALMGFGRARARASWLRAVLALSQLAGRALPVLILAFGLQLLWIFGVPLPYPVMAVLCLVLPFGAWSSLIFHAYFRKTDAASRTSLRGIAVPIAATAALIGPAFLSASIFVEQLFGLPGVSRVFSRAVVLSDPGVIAAFLLMYCIAVVLIGLVAPRSRTSSTYASGRRRISSTGVVALVILLLAGIGALASGVISPFGPYAIDVAHFQGYPLAPGVAGHVLGTDENGRDLLARVLAAVRMSLSIAILAAIVAAASAAAIAKITKATPWFADRDALTVSGIRPFTAFPFIFGLVMALAMRSHADDFLNPPLIALLIGAVSWPAIVPAFRTFTPAALAAVADVTACALLIELTQSAFGFGVQPPLPSLGNMLVNAQTNITVAPWVFIVPSVTAILTLFALYALGDELRARASPPAAGG